MYDTCVETNKWYCELLKDRHHSSPPSLYTTQAMPMRTRSASLSKKRVPIDSTPKKRANSKEGSAVSKRSQSADTRFSSQQPSKDAAHFKEGRKRTERTTKYVPANRSLHPIAPLNSDWMLAPEFFKLLDERFGPFDVDCCAAKDGNNKQPNCKEH